MDKNYLIGSTLIPVRIGKVWTRMSLDALAVLTTPYEVLSWHGNGIGLGAAIVRPAGFVNRVAKIKLANGHKIECSSDNHFPIQTNKAEDRIEYDHDGLKYVPTHRLKTGDRILSVDNTGMKCDPHNALGESKFGHVFVEKFKFATCEPLMTYSVEVAGRCAFVLDSGVFSHSLTNFGNENV